MADNPSRLRFDSVRGGIVKVSPDGRTVKRLKGESDINVVFSTRPISVNEKICFRFMNMIGGVRYGFTSNDPSILNVPGTYYEFFNSPGYWSKKLFRKRLCKIDTVWHYYVNSSGYVHIARNGHDERVYFSEINIKKPFWAIVEIGDNTSLEFVEPTVAGVGPPAQPTPRQLVLTATVDASSSGAGGLRFHNVFTGTAILSRDGSMARSQNGCSVMFSNRPVRINEMVCLSFGKVLSCHSILFGFTRCEPVTGHLHGNVNKDADRNYGYCVQGDRTGICLHTVFYFHTVPGAMADNPSRLRFDAVRGGIVKVSPDGRNVKRLKGESDINIVFSTRPISVDEKICFRFMNMIGGVRYGFTSNDPSILNVPGTDSEFFNSPGYWSKKLFRKRLCKIDTVWHYYVNSSGYVHIARNGHDERVYFSEINIKKPFWAIVEIGDNTSLEFVEPTVAGVGPPAQPTPRQLVLTATVDASSSGAGGLRFHNVFTGTAILSRDGSMARSQNGCSVMFSNRPVRINEMVCLSFGKVLSCHSILFGFTRCEPVTGHLHGNVNKDADRNYGYWCDILEKHYYKQDNILHFHVNSSGDIQFGINGTDKELICLGIDTNVSLWVIIQFWGISEVKFIDSVDYLSRWATEDANIAELVTLMDEQTVISPRRLNQNLPERTNNERNQVATRQQSADVNLNRQDVRRTSPHQPASSHIESVVSHRPTNTAIASSSRNQSANSSNYLYFHPIHGANIEISRDGSTVRCGQKDAFDGIAFSANPIKANEVIAFRILETHLNIGFGFTRNDPVEHSIPETVAFLTGPPPGYWVSFIGPRFCKKDNIWYFYISTSGDIHIGVNGNDVRVFFSVIFHHGRYPHWAFVEIWGDTVLQFVDSTIARVGLPALRTPEQLVLTASAGATCPGFHEVHGDHVTVSNDRFILQSRTSNHEKKGIAFSDRPIKINETVHILFVDVGHSYNFIAFGFTNHNPATLNTLPDYISHEKDNVPGYWANYLEKEISVKGNILHFHVNAAGHIQYGINGTSVGIFCAGIETRNPLWVVVQIRPNNSTIKFIDQIEAEERRAVEETDENENDTINDDNDININIDQIAAEDTDREQNQATFSQQRTDVENQIIPENLNQLNESLTSHYEPTAPPETECIICTEQEANTVFFSCGHICTCYECAEQLWRGSGNGTCPVCRAEIQQILRTYR